MVTKYPAQNHEIWKSFETGATVVAILRSITADGVGFPVSSPDLPLLCSWLSTHYQLGVIFGSCNPYLDETCEIAPNPDLTVSPHLLV
jgi:hypothetical protein